MVVCLFACVCLCVCVCVCVCVFGRCSSPSTQILSVETSHLQSREPRKATERESPNPSDWALRPGRRTELLLIPWGGPNLSAPWNTGPVALYFSLKFFIPGGTEVVSVKSGDLQVETDQQRCLHLGWTLYLGMFPYTFFWECISLGGWWIQLAAFASNRTYN